MSGPQGWRKASYSIGNGECAEVRAVPGAVLVRDSTDRGGTVLAFAAGTWRAFVTDPQGAVA